MDKELSKSLLASFASAYYRNLYNPTNYVECIGITKEEVNKLLEEGKIEDAIMGCIPKDELLVQGDFPAPTYSLLARNSWKYNYCSWALPPRIADLNKIRSIVAGKTVLELGSGSGFWAAILQSLGAKVIATDPNIPDYAFRKEDAKKPPFYYVNVDRMAASKALSKYGKQADILFICWPKWNITKTRFDLFKGKQLIIIGEASGGGTYCGYPDSIDWPLQEEILLPVWETLSDTMRIYKK